MIKNKMIQVNSEVHQMFKRLAVEHGLSLKAYMMKLAYEKTAENIKENR